MIYLSKNSNKYRSFQPIKATLIRDLIDMAPLEKEEVLLAIELEDKSIPIHQLEIVDDTEISDGIRVNFIIQNSIETSIDSICNIEIYLSDIISDIESLILALQKNDAEAKSKHFADLTDSVNIFTEVIQVVTMTIKRLSTIEKHKQQSDLELHLFSIFKAIYNSYQKDDSVALCDLLEYELIDNLQQWKIKVIPLLKKDLRVLSKVKSPLSNNI